MRERGGELSGVRCGEPGQRRERRRPNTACTPPTTSPPASALARRVPSFGELDTRGFSMRGEVGSDHCRCALHTEARRAFEGSAQLRFVGGGRTERSFERGDGRGGRVTRPLGA